MGRRRWDNPDSRDSRSRSRSPVRNTRPIKDRDESHTPSRSREASAKTHEAEPVKPKIDAASIAAAAAARINAQLALKKGTDTSKNTSSSEQKTSEGSNSPNVAENSPARSFLPSLTATGNSNKSPVDNDDADAAENYSNNSNGDSNNNASVISDINSLNKYNHEAPADDNTDFPDNYVEKVDINDIRNKYLLTKQATQDQIRQETGARVMSRGKYYPDRTKATERVPPLYLYVAASKKPQLDKALELIDRFINQDLGSLVDERRFKREEYKAMVLEERIEIGPTDKPPHVVKSLLVGAGGENVKHIYSQTGCRVMVKGKGSGYIDRETNREDDFPMCIVIVGQAEDKLSSAASMCRDLLSTVLEEAPPSVLSSASFQTGALSSSSSPNPHNPSSTTRPPPPPPSNNRPPPPPPPSSSNTRPPPPPPPPSNSRPPPPPPSNTKSSPPSSSPQPPPHSSSPKAV